MGSDSALGVPAAGSDMVRGAGARKSIGQAYGAMQELQELREQAAELADKNRELAKALARYLGGERRSWTLWCD